MPSVVADTHAIIWYFLESQNLSRNALAVLDGANNGGDLIYLASISLVEMVYLVEKSRIPEVTLERLTNALNFYDAGVLLVPLDLVVAQAIRRIPRDMLPDMPDRIIAATALSLNLPLVTRDQRIQAVGIETIW
jgi:PIN domain nuclease of toxin-antitoxin system